MKFQAFKLEAQVYRGLECTSMNLRSVSANKKASFFKLLIFELSTSLRKAHVLDISLIEIPIFERHVVN
jgi:hypothetical protein